MADSPTLQDLPLVVDLDGSILRSDMLLETLVAATRRSPSILLQLPYWLLRGRGYLKARLAERAQPSPEHLPFRQDLVRWLAGERGRGRFVMLATASNERVANAIAEHLGVFDAVLASTAEHNLKGAAKRDALVERFGERGFDYAGDGRADLPSWKAARRPILLVDDPRLKASIGRDAEVEVRAAPRTAPWLATLRALRVHHWTKNLLVLVPLVTAHKVMDPASQGAAWLAFLAFSLAASAIYVVNDLGDLDADRRHPEKRRRPLASGELGIEWALVLAPLAMAASLVLAALVTRALVAAILLYAVAAIGYTAAFKRYPILDVIVLAGLYTLRIYAGALAIDVEVSHWLLAFSTFIFLSLALAKRHAELASLALGGGAEAVPGRSYRPGDLGAIAILGISSGSMSVVILSLYVSSQDVLRLYGHPAMLWLVVPVILYWIARVWLLAWRQELHEDPILFALHDPASYVAGLLCAIAVVAAT